VAAGVSFFINAPKTKELRLTFSIWSLSGVMCDMGDCAIRQHLHSSRRPVCWLFSVVRRCDFLSG
jgi:hypothetical protein